MKSIGIYIKAIAVLLMIGLSVAARGAELLERFAQGGEMRARVGEYANAEIPKPLIDNCRKAIKQGETGEMPFLVKGIKYNCIAANDTVVYINSNQKMVYSLPLGVCVYYSYDCVIKAERLSEGECAQRAEECFFTVFANFRSVNITSLEIISNKGGICSFDVTSDLTGDKKIRVSVRADTGSIVLYDARGIEIYD